MKEKGEGMRDKGEGVKDKMNAKRVLIIGLGRSGVSLARYLLSIGAEVFAYDDNPSAFERVPELVANQAFHIQRDLRKCEGRRAKCEGRRGRMTIDLAISSPGVPDDAGALQVLRRQGIRVDDEIEFGFGIVGRKIIAVTGTSGKSTTTALLGEMLRNAGRNVFCGGNLAPGLPFSAGLLNGVKELYVLEVSSFQLERCHAFAPRIGLLLNITDDHLNRHRTRRRYQELKLSLFRNQTRDDFAVVNLDDKQIAQGRAAIPSRIVTFSLESQAADAGVRDGTLRFRGEPILPARELSLPGRHNIANALAALAAARILNVDVASIVKTLQTFGGLEHRLELVRELNGVKYINNSMCTNPAAAIQSLLAFDAPVILITGGREKGLPTQDYLHAIVRRAKKTILIGENRWRLYDRLRRLGCDAAQVLSTLEEAVNRARAHAAPGDVVLFSPGFASFDAYADFQERGKAFKDAVRQD
jgi:UDP-N-acetylmuramoylalanine--D-glutamate ligase